MLVYFINVGFGNVVASNKVVSVVSPESAPIKRLVQESKEQGTLIDATYGRRTRAVIVMDSGHIVLSPLQPETIAHRLHTKEDGHE
ncbi:MAG: DUF370 domain-containing protein [Gudongella sp.]|jgi:regulator of extracellular matrix RemA (YlzA/DUF370 family)|uniref:extracellular matrix/biofilm regulator RemA n=1 Tax=unclassified Gudongella TaxID=2692383 RepID=UPI00390470E3|nr:DUF370 domain-containing protein [Gudongella sp.]